MAGVTTQGRRLAARQAIKRAGPLLGAIAAIAILAPGGSSAATSPPAPRFAKSVDIGLITGVVIVRPPTGPAFRLGAQDRNIPVGSGLDTTHGAVDLRAAYAPSQHTSGVQDGNFSGGLFEVLQQRTEGGLTELDLKTTLSTARTCAAKAQAASARPSSRTLALLRAKVHGAFRTRGHYAAATARGTRWTMIDRCDGTLTEVSAGVVIVDDFRLAKNVAVSAGHSYLALAR